MEIPTVLEDLYRLIDKHKDASPADKAMVKMAASLVELLIYFRTDEYPPQTGRTLWQFEDYDLLPGRIELLDGRIYPKDWNPIWEEREKQKKLRKQNETT